MKTAIIYGTLTGNAQSVAELIGRGFEGSVVEDVAYYNIEDLKDFDLIILGTSTNGFGELADDWLDKIQDLGNVDLKGKNIALFGTGDQYGYSDSFVGSINLLFEQIENSGANFIGRTSTDGYEFDDSDSVRDGEFLGLAIDEDNQPELTEGRVKNWIDKLKKEAV